MRSTAMSSVKKNPTVIIFCCFSGFRPNDISVLVRFTIITQTLKDCLIESSISHTIYDGLDRVVNVQDGDLHFPGGSSANVVQGLVRVVPQSVEDAGLVRALVCVSPEEVTLGLNQVGGKVGPAVLVVVTE